MPSCVEDDVVEGVIRCVFVDVDDGRGWASGVDGVQIVSTVEDVWLEVQCMSISFVRRPLKSAEQQINPRLPAEAIRLQKHKGTSLS